MVPKHPSCVSWVHTGTKWGGGGELLVPLQSGGHGPVSGSICSHLFLAPALPCPQLPSPGAGAWGW